jgi:MoaA/NifB/PqqE/SkfB family radical SAM enzyme
MADQIKRFITCRIPVTACNFNCIYCYLCGIEKRTITDFVLPPEKLAQRLSVDRLGGICYFNLCADGETMLHPQLIELVKELTKSGHYADIITNGTLTKKFDELIDTLSNEEQSKLMIKFSFHYLQLKEKNLLNTFLENVDKIKKSGISYTVEITPHDELIGYIDEIKSFSMDHFGALPHITVARDSSTREIAILSKHSREDYQKIWGQFGSALFDFKISTFNKKRNEFCYAGDWSLYLDLETGKYRQCNVGMELGNICDDAPMHFQAIGRCALPHCFNGHAFLALGNVPELNSPTYAEERDRECADGTHWLKDDCKKFFSSKLYENNNQYPDDEKKRCLKATRRETIDRVTKKAVRKMKRLLTK